ncbi:spermidine synthase [Corynebacterium poyangense]|uniref:spermidine synthase n=1 Tax=Corynebacterium poyangense TaxID=2684405 RepID=UPI00165D0464|nr:fused MFS/spermidine synthase [Corynebacterium poyangense]
MARKHSGHRQRRRHHTSSASGSPITDVAGTYPIDSGTLEVVRDDLISHSWLLKVNGVPSSHLHLEDPSYLDFEYMRWMAYAMESFVSTYLDPTTLRITHLGGAGCSMARWCVDRWPQSRNTVVEFDAQLAQLVRRLFDLPRSPHLKIRADEARKVITSARPASRDIIIRDVFDHAHTPTHFVTREFVSEVSRSLSPQGLYLANCGDHSDLHLARDEIATLASVFSEVAVIADPPMLKGRRYGNLVLIASHRPLVQDHSPAAAKLGTKLLGGAVPAHYVSYSALPRRLRGGSVRRDP